MTFKIVICPPNFEDDWPDKLRAAVPGIQVELCGSASEALDVIGDADAAVGDVVPELFERATKLRWISCPLAGPPAGFYHEALVASDVVVTNMRDVYSDHISAHIMAFLLAFARGFHRHIPRQLQSQWRGGHTTVHLPEATVVIVGVGGIGAEVARLCAEFGMHVIGVDPRVERPTKGIAELRTPDLLADALPLADFVIVTVPETPATQGLFSLELFRLMKNSAFFINIGRGATVVLEDLIVALNGGEIAGAGLDVYEVEPLPADHPLWLTSGVLLTPHTAGNGPYISNRRTDILVDNAKRFNEGKPLRNVVDKDHWF
ncbi:D-2-hydroxyacid dehydrogenase [Dehalococcoidia bacterium]|nr:D-2-hydroxyacid dehydrogenase [Dehalococcoidia bacterium]